MFLNCEVFKMLFFYLLRECLPFEDCIFKNLTTLCKMALVIKFWLGCGAGNISGNSIYRAVYLLHPVFRITFCHSGVWCFVFKPKLFLLTVAGSKSGEIVKAKVGKKQYQESSQLLEFKIED